MSHEPLIWSGPSSWASGYILYQQYPAIPLGHYSGLMGIKFFLSTPEMLPLFLQLLYIFFFFEFDSIEHAPPSQEKFCTNPKMAVLYVGILV